MVSSTPRPHFTPRERPGTHFTGGWVGPRAGLDVRKSRPQRDSIRDRPARSQSLYRLSYRAPHCVIYFHDINCPNAVYKKNFKKCKILIHIKSLFAPFYLPFPLYPLSAVYCPYHFIIGRYHVNTCIEIR